jgi:hypothetical protein
MALEATVRATTLNEADPNYARNLALSHDINRRDFPPRQSFASLQSEARQYCDDLISAGYIRCRHALAGCDFHLRDNFNRAVSHFDTSNATQENQRSALTADLNILRGRDVAVTLDADQAQQLRDDILQMCENDVYPMRVANWCRTNFANPMCAMWIGVLRIPMYDELIALVRRRRRRHRRRWRCTAAAPGAPVAHRPRGQRATGDELSNRVDERTIANHRGRWHQESRRATSRRVRPLRRRDVC